MTSSNGQTFSRRAGWKCENFDANFRICTRIKWKQKTSKIRCDFKQLLNLNVDVFEWLEVKTDQDVDWRKTALSSPILSRLMANYGELWSTNKNVKLAFWFLTQPKSTSLVWRERMLLSYRAVAHLPLVGAESRSLNRLFYRPAYGAGRPSR